ncbi:CopD family protein [Novosphingobium aquimarinum]|uniref:CopD family protein n=1 Tax=Novosphingobium aquimarinum TaxID=2682494 RepID=UPI0012EB47B6|nr:CopD family protein [Novosphingobium aquimarinum]
MADAALRFLHYAVLLGLFGATAYRVIGFRGTAWAGLGQRPAGWIVAAVAAPLISTALQLSSIAAMMGTPIGDLDRAIVEAMVLGTSLGWAFLIRLALLLAGLIALLASRRGIAALCYAGALLTLGWSGHAAATEGALGLAHRMNNGGHLIAAGLWMGAIGWFWTLTRRARRPGAPFAPAALLSVMHGFAPLGVVLVGAVALTGIVNAQLIFGLANAPQVLPTAYGILLALKVGLVLAMMSFGAHNAMLGRRQATQSPTQIRTEADPTDLEVVLAALRKSLASEFALGIAVIGLVAVLGMLSPMTMG